MWRQVRVSVDNYYRTKTNSGRRVEYTKVDERIILKELGKHTL